MQLVDPDSGLTGGRCNNKDGGSGVGGNGLALWVGDSGLGDGAIRCQRAFPMPFRSFDNLKLSWQTSLFFYPPLILSPERSISRKQATPGTGKGFPKVSAPLKVGLSRSPTRSCRYMSASAKEIVLAAIWYTRECFLNRSYHSRHRNLHECSK